MVMKYPDDYIDKVICGDCLEVMKEIPDNSIDLMLTDPPYGIGETNEKNMSRGKWANPNDYGHYEWDLQKVQPEYFKEIMRVSKNQVIFGGNYYTESLHNSNCWLVWDKQNGKSDFADCELMWTSFTSAVRIFRYRWQGMLQGDMKNKEIRFHPTQKPIPVITWVLSNYTNENDLILDPFLGSGTTIVACKQLNRRFIGIEINPDYCRIARERLMGTPESLFKEIK